MSDCESTYVPLASVSYGPGVTGTGPFSYGQVFDLLDSKDEPVENQLQVFLNGVKLTVTTDYTINEASQEITLVSPMISTDILTQTRVTKSDDRYATFKGTFLPASQHNLDSDQLFFLVQEALDAANEALRLDPSKTYWNGLCLPSDNVAPSIGPNSWVTRAEMEAFVLGGDAADITGATIVTAVGDGVTTDFEITGVSAGISTASTGVYLDGVRQVADDSTYSTLLEGDIGYPGPAGGDAFVVFSTAPADTVDIEIVVFTGTVVSSLQDNVVGTSNIIDNAVTLDKMGFDPNGDDRVILIDSLGDPALSTLSSGLITDFETAVNSRSLSVFGVPTANINWANFRIVSLGTPVDPADAATKGYVDQRVNDVVGVKAYKEDFVGDQTPEVVIVSQDMGFQADIVTVTADVIGDGGVPQSSGHSWTWTAVLQGTTDRFVGIDNPELYIQTQIALGKTDTTPNGIDYPVLRIKRRTSNPNQVELQFKWFYRGHDDQNPNQFPRNVSLFAMKA